MAKLIDQSCTKCGDIMAPIWRAETESGSPELRGWYCHDCRCWKENDLAVIKFHWDVYGRPHRLNGK